MRAGWRGWRRSAPTVALALSLMEAPVVEAQATASVTDSVALRQAAEALVAALSTGDADRIRRFVEERFSAEALRRQGGADLMTDYLGSLFIEHGPLEVRASAMRTMGPMTMPMQWAYGDLSGAWLGLTIDLGSDGIRRFGVQRGPTPGILPVDAPSEPAGIPAYLESSLRRAAEAKLFSGVVVVTRGGEALFQGAYGMADEGAGRAMALGTRIPLASAAKMFTAVAIGQLVQEGVVSFDDRLSKWVPEYPAQVGDQVTVRHLLTHTSGIEMDDDPGFHAALRSARSMEDILAAHLRYLPRMNEGRFQDFHPLDHYDYTNEGIDLLGLIVERASGVPWHEYLHRRVFEPAGMSATASDLLESVPDLVHGYTFRVVVDGRVVPRPSWRPAPPMEELRYRPAGSSVATAGDAARFMDALFAGTLLSRELVEEMTSRQIAIIPQLDQWYGLGFMRWTSDGVASVGHIGGAPGMSTLIEHYPDLGYTVVVLSNHDGGYLGASTRIREAIAKAEGATGAR